MRATSDIFLGWLYVEAGLDVHARDFYCRQLRDWKDSAEIDQMVPRGKPRVGGSAVGRSPAHTPAAATG
jgi:hypothetical protein